MEKDNVLVDAMQYIIDNYASLGVPENVIWRETPRQGSHWFDDPFAERAFYALRALYDKEGEH